MMIPKYLINICLLVIAAAGLSSCEKVITVKLDTSPSQMVIEGVITNDMGEQVVKISRSVPYTDSSIYPAVTGATVTVTDDDGNNWNFVEREPGKYTVRNMRGEAGHKYIFKAIVDQTTYHASSTMPDKVALDSLGLKVISFGGSERIAAEVHFQDPANLTNQYRWILKINGLQAAQVFADDDRYTNGNPVTNVLFYNGNDDDEALKRGDRIEVEMQCIDKAVFTYWYTLSQQTQNGPGGGVTPGNPPSNIDNNALGYFSAQTTERKTLTVN